jgi:hypothetical protein
MVGETEPQVVAVQAAPARDSVQFTPLFCESFCSVAAKVCVAFTCTFGVVGEPVTAIAGGGGAIVNMTLDDLVPSETEVAVRVTVGGVGGVVGAV